MNWKKKQGRERERERGRKETGKKEKEDRDHGSGPSPKLQKLSVVLPVVRAVQNQDFKVDNKVPQTGTQRFRSPRSVIRY